MAQPDLAHTPGQEQDLHPEHMGYVTDAAAAWERSGGDRVPHDKSSASLDGSPTRPMMLVSSLPDLDAPPPRDASDELVAQDALAGETPRLAEGLESEASLRVKLAADVPFGASVPAGTMKMVSVNSSPAGLGNSEDEKSESKDSLASEKEVVDKVANSGIAAVSSDAAAASAESKRSTGEVSDVGVGDTGQRESSPGRDKPLKDIGPSAVAARLQQNGRRAPRNSPQTGVGKVKKVGIRVGGVPLETARVAEKFDEYKAPKHTIKAGGVSDMIASKRKVRWTDTMPDSGLPICAVLGAESLLGGHVVKAILAEGTHVVRAVFESAEEVEFLLQAQRLSPSMISFADVGPLSASGASEVLAEALQGVDCVINCCDLTATSDTGRGAKVADRAVAAARAILDAITIETSTVSRLVHCGSDLSVFDPRSGGRRSAALVGMDPIEPELDENCWYAIDDKERKNSDGEAFGKTAAEMLLWSQASKDDASFTMCSVVSSLMLGPLLTPGHASSPAHKLVVDYVTKAHAIPIIPTPIVDCRDVASCITKLINSHEDVSGRIFMSSESLTSVELVNELRSLYPGFSWPARQVPRWAVSPRVAVPWKMTRRGVKERYGRSFSLSTRRAVSEVGVSFRETCSTIRDTVESLQALACIDLHARKSSRIDPGGRISSRFYSGGIRVSRRRAASGRV